MVPLSFLCPYMLYPTYLHQLHATLYSITILILHASSANAPSSRVSLQDVYEGIPNMEEVETRTNLKGLKNGKKERLRANWMLQHAKLWDFEVNFSNWLEVKEGRH